MKLTIFHALYLSIILGVLPACLRSVYAIQQLLIIFQIFDTVTAVTHTLNFKAKKEELHGNNTTLEINLTIRS